MTEKELESKFKEVLFLSVEEYVKLTNLLAQTVRFVEVEFVKKGKKWDGIMLEIEKIELLVILDFLKPLIIEELKKENNNAGN